jgi:hypothetical protein
MSPSAMPPSLCARYVAPEVVDGGYYGFCSRCDEITAWTQRPAQAIVERRSTIHRWSAFGCRVSRKGFMSESQSVVCAEYDEMGLGLEQNLADSRRQKV